MIPTNNNTYLAPAAREASFRLPKESSRAFPALLRALEAQRRQLGVSSYGMSVTTLEEVFLRVSQAALVAEEAAGRSWSLVRHEWGRA